MFWKTYLSCSPLGPRTVAQPVADGTPVTLKRALPVSASNNLPKLAVDKIAGKTPCWLGSSWSQIRANDNVGKSDLDQISSPVRKSTHFSGPAFDPVNEIGSL